MRCSPFFIYRSRTKLGCLYTEPVIYNIIKSINLMDEDDRGSSRLNESIKDIKK